MKQKTKKYGFSFTAASAFVNETMQVATLYHQEKNWEIVLNRVVEENILHKTKVATAKREFTEIKKRIELLSPAALELLVNGSREDATYMIWLGIVKAYTFISEFVVEVVRPKVLMFDFEITTRDYQVFLEHKSIEHDELNKISELTQYKIKQVLFKMLEQVGIINNSKDKIINRPFLTEQIIELIVEDNHILLKNFLLSDMEINEAIAQD